MKLHHGLCCTVHGAFPCPTRNIYILRVTCGASLWTDTEHCGGRRRLFFFPTRRTPGVGAGAFQVASFWAACVTAEGKACVSLQIVVAHPPPALARACADAGNLAELLPALD